MMYSPEIEEAYRKFAEAILVRAIKDRGKLKINTQLKKSTVSFARSEWCELLCEVVGCDYEAYKSRIENGG